MTKTRRENAIDICAKLTFLCTDEKWNAEILPLIMDDEKKDDWIKLAKKEKISEVTAALLWESFQQKIKNYNHPGWM